MSASSSGPIPSRSLSTQYTDLGGVDQTVDIKTAYTILNTFIMKTEPVNTDTVEDNLNYLFDYKEIEPRGGLRTLGRIFAQPDAVFEEIVSKCLDDRDMTDLSRFENLLYKLNEHTHSKNALFADMNRLQMNHNIKKAMNMIKEKQDKEIQTSPSSDEKIKSIARQMHRVVYEHIDPITKHHLVDYAGMTRLVQSNPTGILKGALRKVLQKSNQEEDYSINMTFQKGMHDNAGKVHERYSNLHVYFFEKMEQKYPTRPANDFTAMHSDDSIEEGDLGVLGEAEPGSDNNEFNEPDNTTKCDIQ